MQSPLTHSRTLTIIPLRILFLIPKIRESSSHLRFIQHYPSSSSENPITPIGLSEFRSRSETHWLLGGPVRPKFSRSQRVCSPYLTHFESAFKVLSLLHVCIIKQCTGTTMATQAALIAETVAGMRRAVADHHDSRITSSFLDSQGPS